MKVYALQLNQNSTADVFHAILPNFRIILGGCFLQENRGGERKIRSDPMVLRCHFLQNSYS